MAKQTNTPNDWRLLADRDMAVADHLANNMIPVPTEIIAYLCQQAVEKYLKGALTILGEEPPYTHDLDKLCRLAQKYHSSFVSISSLCTIITHFSIQPRYDLGISLSEADMRLVLLLRMNSFSRRTSLNNSAYCSYLLFCGFYKIINNYIQYTYIFNTCQPL